MSIKPAARVVMYNICIENIYIYIWVPGTMLPNLVIIFPGLTGRITFFSWHVKVCKISLI